MKRIRLFGDLERFRADWSLNVATPAEAMRAINANRPGFVQAADAGDYVLILVDPDNPDLTRQVTTSNALDAWANETLFVVPRVGGDTGIEIAGGIGAAVASAVGAVGGLATAIAVAVNIAIALAVSLAVSYVASLIAGGTDGMEAKESEPYDSKPSYLFNGVVNTTRQGHRVPLLYGGPLLVGSMTLSSQIHVKDIPT